MADLRSPVQQSLSGSYTLERELGGGGLSFDRAGAADSARAYLTRYSEMGGTGRSLVDKYWLAPVLFRLWELYENASDTKRATEYYSRFVDLWKNADPSCSRASPTRARASTG